MNSKMTTNSQLSSTTEPKRKEKQQKQKLSKQREQEQNQRNGHHITWRDFSGEEEGRNEGGKAQGRSSIMSRHKIDGER